MKQHISTGLCEKVFKIYCKNFLKFDINVHEVANESDALGEHDLGRMEAEVMCF